MEVIILPMLIFVFVVMAIVLFNRLSAHKNKTDKSWKAWQAQIKKQAEYSDIKDRPLDTNLENMRLDYNKNATAYNRLIKTFPTSFMASMAGYKEREIL